MRIAMCNCSRILHLNRQIIGNSIMYLKFKAFSKPSNSQKFLNAHIIKEFVILTNISNSLKFTHSFH